MFEEVLVFRRDESVLHVVGNLLDRNEDALLARELRHQRAIGGVHAACHRRFVILQFSERRQTLQRGDDEADDGEKTDGEQNADAHQNFAPRPTAARRVAIIAIVAIVTAPAAIVFVVIGIVSQHCAPLCAEKLARASPSNTARVWPGRRP